MMDTMKKIAFIESNTTGTGRLFLSKAIEKGYEVIFISADPSRYPFLSELMVVPINMNTANPAQLLAYLQQLKGLRAVFSSSEYFIETAAYLAAELNLPGNNAKAIANCRDKLLLSDKLQATGIRTADSLLITDLESANQRLPEVTFPVVIKPVSGSGSVGVKRCDTKEEYFSHITELLAVSTNERGIVTAPRILVQQYIEGEEFSVEVIATGNHYHVLGITKKYLGAEPYFVEQGHDFPATLAKSLSSAIRDTAIQALKTMDFTFGAAHLELRIHDQKVYIIEINPRLAGGMIPGLIQESLQIDILDLLLDLHSGEKISVQPALQQFSSIRFIIPTFAGTIQDIWFDADIHSMPMVKIFNLAKKVGDHASHYGDYRDRIGYVITSGIDSVEVEQAANQALRAIHISVVGYNQSDSGANTGRLSQSLHADALAVINRSLTHAAIVDELKLISMIDEAHLLMLVQQNIISTGIGAQILMEIRKLKNSHYVAFKDKAAPRGTYLLYENTLIAKLGINKGGVIHTGRSRNDMNATMFKLQTRELFQRVYQLLWKLRLTLLNQAERYGDLAMPIYSQFQPALPATYSFYLLAIANGLSRDQQAFKQLYSQLAESPLGAGAGSGTSFPISQETTAALLGFSHVSPNALDAVASRDLALRLLSTLSILGTTLSRIAQDYQLWTTQEFSFFHLTDELVGSSSMMPQKKNPFLLEKIKGKAISPMGVLVSAMAAMQKTLYCNSVEVGTEALNDFSKAFTSVADSMTLLELIIANAQPDENNLQRSNTNGITMAICASEILVKTGLSFREAHHQVGQAITDAIAHQKDPVDAVYRLLPSVTNTNQQWSETFSYGGGCSQHSIQQQLDAAKEQLKIDGVWMQEIVAFWQKSTILREAAILQCISQYSETA